MTHRCNSLRVRVVILDRGEVHSTEAEGTYIFWTEFVIGGIPFMVSSYVDLKNYSSTTSISTG